MIVTSGTASGKSLAFNMPVLDAIARDPKARAIYLYPTKALAQDQARKLAEIAPGGLRQAIYDGDTPREERPAIRRRSNLILTNPDMLHVGVLPNHKNWAEVLAKLRYVVVDEAHVYRGVFGSHVGNVLRRLRRICALHGSEPRFILTSATIANPEELAERLVGTPFHLVDTDGAPRAARRIAIWNPPLIDRASGSPALGAQRGGGHARRPGRGRGPDDLLRRQPPRRRADPALLRRQAARSRPPRPGRSDRPLPGRLHAPAAARDRGPAQLRRPARRRRHQRARARDRHRRARRGDLRRLPRHRRQPAADVGAGGAPPRGPRRLTWPGSTASTSSSAATRTSSCPVRSRRRSSTTGTSGSSRPTSSPRPSRRRSGGPRDDEILGEGWRERAEALVSAGYLRGARGGGYAVRGAGYPASAISLRSASADSVTVVDADSGELLGTVEAERAFSTVHPGAIYLHMGRSFEVRELDVDGRRAIVRPFDGDWYTQPRKDTDIYIERMGAKRETLGVELHWGAVGVSERVIAFQRKRLSDHEAVDFVELDLPEQTFMTQALWYVLPDELAGPAALPPEVQLGALHASEHTQIAVLPLLAMCDRWDIGGLSTNVHYQTGRPTIFIYDGHPGGVGISRRGYDEFERLVTDAARLVGECPCAEGCPSCVQSPKCGNLNDHLHKGGAIELMTQMLKRRERSSA